MSKEVILGIESSCDDTAAAVVDRDGNVLSSIIASQTHIHSHWGGVYPEFASRAHALVVVPTIERALAEANVAGPDLKAIGVTRGPGLIGSLIVGVNTAAGLGLGWNVPVLGINHLRGHLRSADLVERRVELPAIVLLVSGGHTFLARMESLTSIQLLGSTRDDSVGEAYDKVREPLASAPSSSTATGSTRASRTGSTRCSRFPRPMLTEGFEFSFSGLKSAVGRYLDKNPDVSHSEVAASFVSACMEILLTKCRRALVAHPSKCLVVVGGVAASPQLREGAAELCDSLGVKLCLPPLKWSTDNAAMIGLAAWDYLNEGVRPPLYATASLPITDF